MDFIIQKNRIYLENSEGAVIAEILFPQKDETTVSITKTFVDPSLRGQGIAGILMEKACEEIKRQGKKIEPLCSYAVKWLDEHPQYKA